MTPLHRDPIFLSPVCVCVYRCQTYFYSLRAIQEVYSGTVCLQAYIIHN